MGSGQQVQGAPTSLNELLHSEATMEISKHSSGPCKDKEEQKEGRQDQGS